MRRIIVFWIVTIFAFSTAGSASAATIATRLSGRILLQIQSRGEAWYVDPASGTRFFLGRPNDAFTAMKMHGLGIRHAEILNGLASRFPPRLSGRILLDVENHGEAYYVVPDRLSGIYLGRPEDAFSIMRAYALGITNADLAKIPVNGASPPAPEQAGSSSATAFERRAFDLVNAYRVSVGLSPLAWSDDMADIARAHSSNMASGAVPFGHEGFEGRVDAIAVKIPLVRAGENVAKTNDPNPADASVQGWLASPGHLENIVNGSFNESGMGVARDPQGFYYLTQIFIQTR